jgi:hypothetical protein
MERFGTLECWPERTHDGHLEAIEDPCDTESNDDKNVEAAPGQSIEPERDIGVNDAGRSNSSHSTPSKTAKSSRGRSATNCADEVTPLRSRKFSPTTINHRHIVRAREASRLPDQLAQ